MQWCSRRQGSLHLYSACMGQSSCCSLKVRDFTLGKERERAMERKKERERCQKPSVSHLCSELRPTLLTEPSLSCYAFGHHDPTGDTKAAQNCNSCPLCWPRSLGITHFTLGLSPPAGSPGEQPQCAAVRLEHPLPQDCLVHSSDIYKGTLMSFRGNEIKT